MKTKIILIGKQGSGKNHLVKELAAFGNYAPSYTTRPKRAGEIDGIDYFFRTEPYMRTNYIGEAMIFNNNYYFTTQRQYNYCSLFIMSPSGIKANKHTIKFLSKEDRDKAIIILVKSPFLTRMKRLRQRGWGVWKIINSIINDYKLFKGFTDYDKIIISNK